MTGGRPGEAAKVEGAAARPGPRFWVSRVLALAVAAPVTIWAVQVSSRVPANDRAWAQDQARLAFVHFQGGEVRVTGIRDFRHGPDGSVLPGYREETFRPEEARRVWFVLAPFATRYRALAHSFLSFEFDGGRFVAVSVEARREEGEEYALLGGLGRSFELAYVVGAEEDLLGLRALRGDTLFLYPSVATPAQTWTLFVDMLERSQAVQAHPEFYNTLFNNCTTNIRNHVNRLTPGRLPWGWGVLLPGFSDALALERGLLATHLPLDEARARHRVDERVRAALAAGAADFSHRIREEDA